MAKVASLTVKVTEMQEVRLLVKELIEELSEALIEKEYWETRYWELLGNVGGVSSP